MKYRNATGFTIVELLIVIVVIAILATVIVVAYNGITAQSKSASLQSDVRSLGVQIQNIKTETGAYPASVSGLQKSSAVVVTKYDFSSNGFCLSAEMTGVAGSVYTDTSGDVKAGECPPPPVLALQSVTTSSCPAERTLAVDERDNRSYWIKRIAGVCWMLTNLAYTGGGVNTHGDVKTIQNGTADDSSLVSATIPKYYTPAGANPTSTPTLPSTSTDGGVTGRQYGYLYNWCAAMGAQLTTSACSTSTTPPPDLNGSLCPSGWRLPTGAASGGDYVALNNAINGGATNTTLGLRNDWHLQYAGIRNFDGFQAQGTLGYYWTNSQNGGPFARLLTVSSSGAISDLGNNGGGKSNASSIRCVTL